MIQVGELGRLDEYNYEIQATYFLDEEVEVRNGDVLTTTCVFDSMDMTCLLYTSPSPRD